MSHAFDSPVAPAKRQDYMHPMAQAITPRDPRRLSINNENRSEPGPVRSDGPAAISPVPLRPASEDARDRFRATLAKTLARRSSEDEADPDR